jgi:hypothetical protein
MRDEESADWLLDHLASLPHDPNLPLLEVKLPAYVHSLCKSKCALVVLQLAAAVESRRVLY